ncbi:TonB-dependent receptor [Rhabdobacter roseus]|uniref:Outer membrane receptor for ferrienterochelin and colicin n=1 Tax=Rhabdobacter roseus TaxID=1655419 RepID=A0A840U1D8_9BACT|nr:TonB-dependent receptor [Rhabdobacter roseus]MBB5285679.1 outer membrane receptor for ferrienterochelin and colicin [Rhabdobacter roseus]
MHQQSLPTLRTFWASGLLTLLLLLAASGYAQAQLEVQVVDLLLRQPQPFVTVRVLNAAAQFEASAQTNEAGKAVFAELPPAGRYRVVAESQANLAGTEVSSVSLLTSGITTVLLELPSRRESILDEVVVSDRRTAQLNVKDAQVSYYVTKKEIQALPIEGRDITRSLYRLPNLTLATLGYAEAPNVSINGLNGTYTNYMIDGLDNNERFLGNMKFNTPVGFAEGITVLTNNYSVEYGNTSNGVVNVTSRSGSNDFSGEVFYLTRPGSILDASSAYATLDLSGNQVKDGFQRHQLGVALGGALKKNKTFYYLNFEQTLDKKDNLLNSPLLGVNEIVTGRNEFSYASGKIDQLWSTRFKSTVRVNVGRFDIDRQGGGLEGGVNFPSSASAQRNRTYLIALKNSYSLTDQLTLETNYQHSYFRWNYREPVNPNSPSVTVQAPTGAGIAVLGQSGSIFDSQEYSHQLQQKLFYSAGRHSLKAGVEFMSSAFSLLGGGNPNGTYTVRLTDAQLEEIRSRNLGGALDVGDIPRDVRVITYDVELRPTTFGTTQNVFNIYVEDNFEVNNRLNLNFGLRYDYDNLSKGGGTRGDLNNLAPRASFNLKVGGRGVIRGGYGLFYDKIKYSAYSDALQFNSSSADYQRQLSELQRLGLLDPAADLNRITFPGNIRATATNVSYLNGPQAEQLQARRERQFTNNLRVLNPNGFRNPYSHQFSLGYQYKPTEKTLFYVDFVHTATNDLYMIRNLNPAAPFPNNDPNEPKKRTVAEADATRPVPILPGNIAIVNGDTLRGISRNVYVTTPEGKARYWAANFVFHKLPEGGKLGYRFNYALALVKSNTSSLNTRAQDSNNFEAEYSYDEQDRRHVLNGMLFYSPVRNLTITPAFLLQSGQPYTILADAQALGTSDLNGDSEFFWPADYSPGEKRHGRRLPWAKTLDLSVKYALPVVGKSRLELSADVFNVLNTTNISGYNVTRGASNQIQYGSTFVVRSAAPPRQFQFGVRYFW